MQQPQSCSRRGACPPSEGKSPVKKKDHNKEQSPSSHREGKRKIGVENHERQQAYCCHRWGMELENPYDTGSDRNGKDSREGAGP